MRVQHASQRDVHEEALRCALGFGESPVLQVGVHDARVVRSVPVAPRRSRAELEPEPHGLRRRLAGQPTQQRDRFAPVPQQSLVDRPPPHAAGRRRVERVEHTPARLPAHERQRCSSERQVSRCVARRPVEDLGHQGKARRRIVAYGRDLRFSPGERGRVVAHRRVVLAVPLADDSQRAWLSVAPGNTVMRPLDAPSFPRLCARQTPTTS